MADDILGDYEDRLKKAVDALRYNLGSIRTGRASPALVEQLQVDAYGAMMPLNQLASISAPDARLLVIQPYDASMIQSIEKAIRTSDIGINPSDDGRLIRLAIPQPTEERRRELVKIVRSRVEEGKVSIRNQRRDSMNDAKQLEQEKLISEDDLRRAQDRIQTLTERYTKDMDQIGSDKEAEVMEV